MRCDAADGFNDVEAQVSNEHLHPILQDAIRPFAPPPRHQACGVIHFEDGWCVYWDGEVDHQRYPDRTAAILELQKRDRAERFIAEQS